MCLALPFIEVKVSEVSLVQVPFILIQNDTENIIHETVETEYIVLPSDAQFTSAYPINEIKPVKEKLSLGFIIAIIYFIGFAVNLIILCKSIYSMFRIIRSGKRIIYKNNRLVIVDGKISPFSFRKYIVISREDYANNPLEIITHEKAHIDLRHTWDLIFMELLLLFQWFNPALWLLKRELRDVHEFQADMHVLKSGIDAKTYQLLLVKKAVGSSSYTLANSFNHSKIKKRITMMLKIKSSKWAKMKILLLLPAGILSIYAFAKPEVIEPLETMINYESTNILPEKEIQGESNVSANIRSLIEGEKYSIGDTIRNPNKVRLRIRSGKDNGTKLLFPLKLKSNHVISTKFGSKKEFRGINIKGDGKDTVYAVKDGVVVASESRRIYGNVIVIKHDDVYETLYAHNSENLVQVGQSVKAGQSIAITGSTGRSDDDHLYFEIRKNRESVRPQYAVESEGDRYMFSE